jgi:DNA-binding MarR family transcriptional regulator
MRKLYGIDTYQDFIIGLVECEPNNIAVADLIRVAGLEEVASLGTIHKAMMACINDGYIELKTDKKDKRRKVLTLTKKAKNYLTHLRETFGSNL